MVDVPDDQRAGLVAIPAAAGQGRAAVSVVIPARNEEATVGAIVTAIRSAFVRSIPLVDEVIVVDSRSADGTATVARAQARPWCPRRR